MRIRSSHALLLAALALPAGANTLYKSVDASGTVMFSDVPPPSGARILEERALPSSPPQDATAGLPQSSTASTPVAGLEQVYGLMDSDKALAEANARVDQAERGLAMARNGASSRLEGLRLASTRNTADNERIEFYKRDLRLARRALVDLIKARQKASMEPGAPRIVASNGYGSLLGAVR
jgi:hypothetical protein